MQSINMTLDPATRGWCGKRALLGLSLLVAVCARVLSLTPEPCGPCVCVHHGPALDVDCSSRSLTSVPHSGLPTTATSLSLRNNCISYLDPGAFPALRALRSVDLSHNNISAISNGAFRNVPGLSNIDLSANRLTFADEVGSDLDRPFAPLPSLSYLDLSRNRLDNATPSVFKDLSHSLRWLNLAYNGITNRGDSRWPTRFLRNLTHLDLSHNKVPSVNRAMFQAGLQYLLLCFNTITLSNEGYPEDSFVDIGTSLIDLDLRGNCQIHNLSRRFRYPDKALSKLVNLQYLAMDSIPEQAFGPGFQNLINLKRLSLSGQWGGFCFMHTLKNDTFVSLPPSLRTLDITQCNISTIEPNAFATFRHSLHTLNLSYNAALGFEGLGSAVYGLQGSVLKELRVDAIVHPHTLLEMVTGWHTRYFHNTSLEVIYARDNRLDVFCQGALSNMPSSLSRLYLKGNRLRCGYYLHDMKILANLTYLDVDGYQYARGPPRPPPRDDTQCRAGRPPDDRHLAYTTVHSEAEGDYGQQGLQAVSDNWVEYVLPPKLKKIKSHWNQLFFRMEYFRFDPNNSLTSLYLGKNLLTTWTGPVTGLVHLETLDLSDNQAFSVRAVFFKDFPSLKTLIASRNKLRHPIGHDKQGSLFAALDKLEFLYLSRNNLNVIPRQIFRGLPSLRKLVLSHNQVDQFDVNLTHMHRLTHIDLSYNAIKVLSPEVTSHLDSIAITMDFYLDLAFNPLACTCSHEAFLQWLERNKASLQHSQNYTCLMADGDYHKIANLFQVVDELSASCIDKLGILIGATCCAFCLLLALVSALLYRFRWKLRYLYYASRLAYGRTAGPQEFRFDAFVSYSSEDEDFVHGELLEELETRAGLRLNVDDRDFTPGRTISWNIVNAVQNSRRTLVVLTRALVQSNWCHYEMQMATMEAAHSGRDVLLFLVYEDMPSQDLPRDVLYNLQASTYITFPAQAPPPLVRDFWSRLAQAIRQ